MVVVWAGQSVVPLTGDHMSLSSSAVPVVRLSLTFLVLSLSLSLSLSQVQTIYWRLPLLNWSRAVLRSLLPRVRLVTTDAPPPTGCRGFGAAPAAGAYWRFKSTAKSLRQVNPNPKP